MLRLAPQQHVTKFIRKASTVHKAPAPSTQTQGQTHRGPPPRITTPIQHAKVVEPDYVAPKRSAAEHQTFARSRALPWVLLSISGFGIAFYSAALLSEARKPLKNPEIADISQQKDVSGRYEDTADAFDSEVGVSETLMGVNRLRKRLAKKCTGHVLEASCGTGRNLGYFDVGKKGNVESLTFVDLSPQMVDICKRKWLALYGDQTKLKSVMQVRFLTGSAIERMPPAPTKEKYDTIIQTMGLCSTPSPVELLTNLVRHLDVSNPDARILLLEHGRSYKDWLNRILDNAAEKHAEIHGCWFNRDIGALVEDAAKQTGLEIVNERRHHFGTTWVFELKPGPEAEKLASLAKTTPVGVEEKAHPATTWRSWFGLK